MMGFHTPDAKHKDTYALAALSMILSDGSRSNRLYNSLVDKQLATSTFCSPGQQRDPFLFMVGATAAPGVDVGRVERVILKEIARLASKPISVAELNRAKAANRKATTRADVDPMGKSNQIVQAEAVADWEWYLDYDEKFDEVTPADIQRVAAQYLVEKNRTVGVFTPAANKPAVAEGPKPQAKEAKLTTGIVSEVLPNGLKVILLPRPGTKVAAVSGTIPASEYFALPEKKLVASLAAGLLLSGSKKYSKEALAKILATMSISSFRIQAANNFCVRFDTHVVSGDLSKLLDVLSNVIVQPKFLADELETSKAQTSGFLQQQLSNTGSIAYQRMTEALYPGGSAHRDKRYDAYLAELPTITRDDLVTFHEQRYVPGGSTVVVVGDIDVKSVLSQLRAKFGHWSGQPFTGYQLETVALPEQAARINVEIPDKRNVDICLGLPVALKRSDPDYFAAHIANAALGQDTLSSRLGVEVREKQGLTYGIYSQFTRPAFGGAPWRITLSVNPKVTDRAIEETMKVVRTYRQEGIGDKELCEEMGRATGTFLVGLRTPAAFAQSLLNLELAGVGPSGLDTYVSQLQAVTREQVNAAIEKYFDIDRAVTVVAGTLS
jgi:zinc protease